MAAEVPAGLRVDASGGALDRAIPSLVALAAAVALIRAVPANTPTAPVVYGLPIEALPVGARDHPARSPLLAAGPEDRSACSNREALTAGANPARDRPDQGVAASG